TRDEESFDPIPKTPENSEDEGNGDEDLGLNVGGEEGQVEEEEEDELYRDININQGRGIQETLEVKDSHVTLTLTPTSVAHLPISAPTMTPSTIATITTTSQVPILPTTSPSTIIRNLPNFGSLFVFDNRLRTLEANFFEFMQTNQFAGAVYAIPRIVQRYMDQRMNKAVKVVVQIQSDRLRDEAQRENEEFLKTVDENMQKIIKEQTSYVVAADLSEMELKKIIIEKMEGNKDCHSEETVTLKRRHVDYADKDEEPSAGPDWGSKRRREGKEPESASAPTETAIRSTGRSTQGSRSRQASVSESALADEPMQTTSQMEEPSHPEFDTGAEDQPIVQSSQHPEWFSQQQKPTSPDRDWNKTLPAVDTLTPELLAGPTYELMKGSCKNLVELEYHLEEVFKATTDQLDWVNPEGQQYPHNLLKPLPLIPNNRGRRVIPFEHFINNDLEYLRGGASSRKYTTSITKTKATDYGHIKRIKYLVPRTMWIEEPIGYDKHALLERRIIDVTELKIIEWHSYKYLDWITVRRDDDKLYKFKEGNFKRLRIQDIEDMLLLLRRVEDLQLGVESYQKKLNLTKPDLYRSDLKHKEAYTTYSNPRGFIYQNKDKKNRLMRIDELHKFSDGTLTDVRTALDDRLKGIWMQYLPQSI
nr:hypothetical protein [Tanacetum cinerariifolium]